MLKGLKDLERKFKQKINCTVIDEDEYRMKRKKKDAVLRRLLSGKRISLIGRI